MNSERFESLIGDAIPRDRVERDAALAPLTTFKVGGPADWLIEVRSAEELEAVSRAAGESGVPLTVLGGGSNVLVGDRGVRGAVLRLRFAAISQPAASFVRAEAGATINALVRWTIGRGLAGLEAWAGTPGTVGGAIYGNAHYQGRNIGELVTRAALLTRDGRLTRAAPEDLGFGYDTSRLKTTGEILVWAEFAVGDGAPDRLRDIARASLAHRKRTQPLETPSAGCVFQNPDPARDALPDGVPPSAGALIDRAGLKGACSGGARISPTHANFFVNDGRASALEIRRLIDRARDAVRARFGVELRDEIVMMGEF
jgi:UDP-N-acetylmuramate dehydrogenase